MGTYRITESKLSTILNDPTKAEREWIGITNMPEALAIQLRAVGNQFFIENNQDRYWHIEKEY